MKALDKAIARYLEVVGNSAIQPNKSMSTLTRNGTAFLRNINGTIAVVTSKGQVLDRIGGSRLDADTTDLLGFEAEAIELAQIAQVAKLCAFVAEERRTLEETDRMATLLPEIDVALSTAAGHIAQGEAPQALARMREVEGHIKASVESKS